MKRREFRLISGQGAGPSVEDITKRPATRRHFKTLQVGGQKTENRIASVTIKGIDKTDGTTVWEYGPGSFWRHHYGADAISGVVPNTSATLNKYAICAGSYPAYNPCGNRNAASLSPNVMEAVSVVKLDSTDGTTIESAVLTGFFCGDVRPESFALVLGITITNAAALSGGDYVIVGERLPFIEFVDYNTNTVNKEYVLHAHGQQNGNVYLKTRTSNETITIPYNAAASAVETLFEATSDCVAATATGGPWPLLPISIDVEWSVSGGDIASISATDTYTATGTPPVNTFTTNYSIFPFTTAQLILSVSVVSIDSIWSFTFDGGGATFDYTSTTDDPATFITALEAAMESFKTSQGTDGFWDSAVITETGGDLHVTYAYAIRHLRVTVDDGVDPVEDSRRAGSCAAAYDTGTGAMTSAVGYEFGYSADRSTLRMFSETGSNPTVTGLNVLGIRSIGSGQSDTVVVTPQLRGTGDIIKANVVEKWTISGGAWSFGWQTYCNAEMAMPLIIPCESGYVICPINAKKFDGVRDRTAARIAVSDTTTVELNTIFGSLTAPENHVSTAMFDNTPGSYLSWGYDGKYQDAGLVNNRFQYNPFGTDTWVNGTEFRIGASAFGCDGTTVFGISRGAVNGGWRYDGIGDSTDSELYIKFLASPFLRSAEPQQFRFKVNRMTGTNYTAWLDWYATESEIETALNNLLGSGNCSIVDFGSGIGQPISAQNTPVSIIECNPMIEFKVTTGFSPGSGRIPNGYFTFRNDGVFVGLDDIVIETQTTTAAASPAGISAYDASDATVTWSRAWGTKGSQTISQPLHAWLEGDYVYAYGNIVDNEL
jgi:hypothetical protein